MRAAAFETVAEVRAAVRRVEDAMRGRLDLGAPNPELDATLAYLDEWQRGATERERVLRRLRDQRISRLGEARRREILAARLGRVGGNR